MQNIENNYDMLNLENYYDDVIFDKSKLRTLFNTDIENMTGEQKAIFNSLKTDKDRNKSLMKFLKNSVSVNAFKKCFFKNYTSLMYFEKNDDTNNIPELKLRSKKELIDIFEGCSDFCNFFIHCFKESDDNYKLKLNFDNENLIINENGQQKINLSKPIFKHKIYETTKEINENVEFILEFIKIIICDGCEKSYNLMNDCLSKICKGLKLDVFLYLYSHNTQQGCGKSTFFRIIELLVGLYNVIPMNDSIVKSRFNSSMYGFRIVKLDDLSPSQETMDKIKEWTTNDKISFESKNKDSFVDVNHSTFIVSTNTLPPKEQSGGRRNFFVNPSTKNIGDHEYWKKMDNILNDPKNISHLFYLLKSRVTPHKLQPQLEKIPCYGEGLRKMLPSLYRYLISEYILANCEDIQKIRTSEFHANYKTYMNVKNYKEQHANDITQMLRDVGITQVKNSVWFYQFSVGKLKELFIRRKFITYDMIDEHNYDNGTYEQNDFKACKVSDFQPASGACLEGDVNEPSFSHHEKEELMTRINDLEFANNSLNLDFSSVCEELNELRQITEAMETRIDDLTEYIENKCGKEVKFDIDAFTNNEATVKIVDKVKKEKKIYFHLSDTEDEEEDMKRDNVNKFTGETQNYYSNKKSSNARYFVKLEKPVFEDVDINLDSD